MICDSATGSLEEQYQRWAEDLRLDFYPKLVRSQIPPQIVRRSLPVPVLMYRGALAASTGMSDYRCKFLDLYASQFT